MNKLIVSLPTRGRPQQLLNTLARTVPNIASSATRIMVQVDDDDLQTIQALSSAPLPKPVIVNVKPREDTVAEKFERALAEPADVYVTMADEHPIITPGFDVKYLEAAEVFPDGLGWIYGRCANASFPSTGAVTAKFCEAIGYLYPKYFPYWFVDHWTDDVCRIIGRICYADIATDPTGGGKTQELREPAWWATFFDAAYLMRRKQAHDLIQSERFEGPPWLKDLLLRHHPMIEFRSRWINDGVRASHHQLSAMNGSLTIHDPRYQRKKEQAMALVPHLLNDYGMLPQEAEMFRLRLLPPTKIPNIPRVNPPPPAPPPHQAAPPQQAAQNPGSLSLMDQPQQQIRLAPVQGYPGLFAAVPPLQAQVPSSSPVIVPVGVHNNA